MRELQAFGSNGSGQLGLGHCEDVPVPQRCHSVNDTCLKGSISIAAGGNHTLLLNGEGKLWATGDTSGGRTGLDVDGLKTAFSPVTLRDTSGHVIDQIKLASATWEASTFVSRTNNVYTCGVGSKGELGQGPNIADSQKPQPLKGFPPSGLQVVDLAASMRHTVLVLSNGDVYGWGNGRRGQLGPSKDVVWQPRKVEGIPFAASRAVCGRDFTFIVGPPSTGKYILLGTSAYELQSSAPEKVQHWKEISASWCSVYVLLQNGKLLSWGRNDRGQLAPRDLPAVHSIAAGSEHVVARTLDDRVLAWGWGEHGNCGLHAVVGSANLVSSGSGSHSIGAGCATSFFVASSTSTPT